MADNYLRVTGAKVHNLKNIDVTIPHKKFVVITGLSGSGKSSLAFDTIFAEGQRRYIETFSAYARSFIGNLERPDVDKITGLSPVISIEQKSINRNPRSTVGTITEIYDFLRLIYARASDAYSEVTGKLMIQYTENQILDIILEKYIDKRIYILAPLIQGRKGHYQELFENLRRKGYLYVRLDGEIIELKVGAKTDRYKTHFIELIVDKILVTKSEKERIKKSLSTAMKQSKGICLVLDIDSNEQQYFSKHLMCPESGLSYNLPAPHNFSFNSPQGACAKCNGLGYIYQADLSKIIPNNNVSIAAGGIAPLGKYKSSIIFWQLEAIASKFNFLLKTPIKDIPEEAINTILYGSDESLRILNSPLGANANYFLSFNGVINYLMNHKEEQNGKKLNAWSNQFIEHVLCPECNGARLKKESLNFKVDGKNISELANMDISELNIWLKGIEQRLSKKNAIIAADAIIEVKNRLQFLINVGIDYLSLNRSADSLSGGESQRIRLATQIGSKLVNVLYILDEPSIGLHQHDNEKLINSLKDLRDRGNSVIVVEHDRQTILMADYVIDMGPYAGINGGNIVAIGSPTVILNSNSLTANYLKDPCLIPVPEKRRVINDNCLTITGAKGNNLKNVSVKIPLGLLVCVTGKSGSGKSTLIKHTLLPILSKKFYRSLKAPLNYDTISGIEHLDKVIEVDQSPIGRTPRSNPLTYTNIFNDIRAFFETLPDAKIRGYKAGRFSFNVKGGRCETCKGAGVIAIEMNFLPDVYVQCNECNGKRYNQETLQVKYKGKSIFDILEMTFNQSVDFFDSIPNIRRKLNILKEVGLGYLKLGQPSTTLSGGEAQRIKISAELMKKDTGKTLYIFDEPTTGLHFHDIKVLLNIITRLLEKGNTVIIIEHNLDIIKYADYVIDMGPEGGNKGGYIVAEGSPEEIVKNKNSLTGKYLSEELMMCKKNNVF